MDKILLNQLQTAFNDKAHQCLSQDLRAEGTNSASRGDGEQTSRNEILAIYANLILDDFQDGCFTLDADGEPMAQGLFEPAERAEFVAECVAGF